MHIANIEWYNANERRKYPLVDGAAALDREGDSLPTDLIVDINIAVPDTDIGYAYISSVVVSEHLVTVTLGHYSSNSAGPLLALSINRSSSNIHRNLRLDSYMEGAIGWLVLGRGIENKTGKWVFDTPSNTKINDRCLHKFKPNGVTSLSVGGNPNKITGTIEFLSADPQILRIYNDTRNINGTNRNCLVFGLNTLHESLDVLQRYVGECFTSPDSETCSRSSVYAINHATPDCDGRVYINIVEVGNEEMIVPRKVDSSKILLDYEVGLSGICDKFEVSEFPSKVDDCDDIDIEERPLRQD